MLINATTKGNGQIAGIDDGSEPVFDDEYPFQQAVYNANKGITIKLSAKADEGWTFKEWKNKQTRETYSTDASVTIEANEALELVAVFAADDAVEHTFTDDQLEIWAEKDYQDFRLFCILMLWRYNILCIADLNGTYQEKKRLMDEIRASSLYKNFLRKGSLPHLHPNSISRDLELRGIYALLRMHQDRLLFYLASLQMRRRNAFWLSAVV